MLLRGSIKKNLTFMMTAITVGMTTIVAIIVIVIDQEASREALLHRVDTLSRIISVRSVAAITFDDSQTAEAILDSLSEESSISSSCIYKQGDVLFASYYKDAGSVCVQNDGVESTVFTSNALSISRPVVWRGRDIGQLVISSSLSEIKQRFIGFSAVVSGLLVATGFVTFLIANKLQSYITSPLIKLSDFAKQISTTEDYSATIVGGRDDEIGALYTAFNAMIGQVRHRSEQRDKVEKTLRQNEVRLNKTQELANLGSWDWDVKSNEIVCSKETYRVLGVEVGCIEINPDFRLLEKYVLTADIDKIHQSIRSVLEQGNENIFLSFRIRKQSGEIRFVEVLGEIDYSPDKSIIQVSGSIQDITERKRALDALRESENRYRTLVESASVSIHELDLEGRVISVNSSGLRIMGINHQDQARGRAYIDIVGEEDRPRIAGLLTRTCRGEASTFEFKSGSDKEPIYLDSSFVPLKDGSGQVQRLMGITIDVTEKIKSEELLRRTQKMDAIGQLSGGIAHDFNNILATILGNLYLLRMEVEADEKITKRIASIELSAQRAAELTKQLLGFSRSKAVRVSTVNINRALIKMENLIAGSITPEIELVWCLEEDLWLTEIDPGDFQDVILNLVINARDAIESAGSIVLETTNATLDDQYCKNNPGAIPGDYVQLSVSDSGMGIPADIQDRIFEPFFTTKDHDGGTGLGLAMVFGFVHRSNAHIKVYSELDQGTTFRLYLPRSIAFEASKETDRVVEDVLPRGSEIILVVDDEEDLLAVAKETLEGLGYQILTAPVATDALNQLENTPGIRLLFSDVIMPGGINGYELAAQATVRRPELKVLLTSGFAGKVTNDIGKASFARHFISKPYSVAKLARRVRDILDADGAEPS